MLVIESWLMLGLTCLAEVISISPVLRRRRRLTFRLRFPVRNGLLVERLAPAGRLTLLVRQLQGIGRRGGVRLGGRVDEPVVRRQGRVRAESGPAVTSPVLLGLVGVGSLGDVAEPPERKKDMFQQMFTNTFSIKP